MLTPRADALTLPPAIYPGDQPIPCACCGALTTRDTGFSADIALIAPHAARWPCVAGAHLGCSPECAARLAAACLEQHIIPALGGRA